MNSMAHTAKEDDWRSAVRAYRENSSDWDRRTLGARPGHAGCRCPAHILAEEGFPIVLAFQPKEIAPNHAQPVRAGLPQSIRALGMKGRSQLHHFER